MRGPSPTSASETAAPSPYHLLGSEGAPESAQNHQNLRLAQNLALGHPASVLHPSAHSPPSDLRGVHEVLPDTRLLPCSRPREEDVSFQLQQEG